MFELVRDSILSIVVRLAPRFANVLLFILIGRLTGPAEAGVFTLAITYLVISTTIARGLDDLVIRQVSREPDRASRYLTNFLILRLGLSLLSYCILLFVVLVVFDYDQSTAISILTLVLSLVPDSLTYVAQAILLGQRCFGMPAIILAGVSLFKLVGGGLVLINGGGLQQVAWVWVIASLLGMVALLIVAVKRLGGIQRADWFDWLPLARNWRTVLSFLLITTLMTLEGQLDVVLLSALRDEVEVGWYGAATTVVASLVILSQGYRLAVYPLMTRYALYSPEKLSGLYKRSIRYLGALVLPMVAGVALLSPKIVSLVFGPEFQPTARVLEISILALVFMFLNVPNSRMMLVHDRQSWSSLFLLVSVSANALLNLALDPAWGATGAAVARLCSSALLFLLNYLHVARFLVRSSPIQLLSRSALATLVMGTVIWLVRTWPLPVSIGVGIATYAGMLWLVGGILPNDAALMHQTIAGWRNRAASTRR
ncbi:MAG: flippase [Anaerolineae bacterium]